MKRGLVISAGGALGAYGAGTLAAINGDYDVVAGLSTGALMSGFASLKKWDSLKEAYTSVTDDDIFDKKWYRPHAFKKNGDLNLWAIVYVAVARIFGRRSSINTLATSGRLRKLIDKFLFEEDYNTIRSLNKEVVVGAVNINEFPSSAHYFSSNKESFNDFKDWTWASSNAPFVTTLLEKKWFSEADNKWYNGEWTDGALTELAPFDYMFKRGVQEIDVILHRAKPVKIQERPLCNDLLQNLERTINAMRYDIEFEDGKLSEKLTQYAKDNSVKIRVFWLPKKLTDNSLIFNKKIMLHWYDEGFKTAFDQNRVEIFE